MRIARAGSRCELLVVAVLVLAWDAYTDCARVEMPARRLWWGCGRPGGRTRGFVSGQVRLSWAAACGQLALVRGNDDRRAVIY